MQYNQPLISDIEENNFSFREQIEHYSMKWKWFALGVFIMLSLAFFYLRYLVPQYKAAITISIKDEKKGGISELAAFSDLSMLSGNKSNVDNEIEILKSRTLIQAAVKKLGLNITYSNIGRVNSAEIYKNVPIEILFSQVPDDFYKKGHLYRVERISDSNFLLYDDGGTKIGNFAFGQVINHKNEKFVIFKKQDQKLNWGNFTMQIAVSPIENIADSFKSRLSVTPLSKTTSIVELSLIDPVPEKAEDFLNTLISNYNEDAIADKNFISENTSKFIEQRLDLITRELDGVEKEAETFKKTNRITDITSDAGLFMQNASDFEKKEIEIETQLKVVKAMSDFVAKNTVTDLIPANILTSDGEAAGLIDRYNQLVLERNRLLKNAGPNNVVLQNIDNKIAALKTSIKSSLVQQKTALEINRNDLAKQNTIVNGKISQMPTLERESRILGRQQQIKETLYLYLLQKREETAISLTVTEPNAKVIDSALAMKSPISPQKNIIYLGAFILGLLIPFGIIYLIDLLDTKIKSRFDIDAKSAIPFIGDVPTSHSHNEIITKTSRTGAAEALRIIRTNLEFMLNEVPAGRAKTIFITSTVPKEGKTFIAVNLAGTIALSGKKVLLMGMDIRNPKLGEYLELPNKGITNYLSSKEGAITDYIVKHKDFEEFYIFPAGVIPPNPAELLMNKKIDELFTQLKKEYDYIVVDTAPVSLVTDTLIISKNADTFVYVVRANFLDKRMLHIPERFHKDNKLPNMSLLLNDTQTNKGYGYGYGYGVEEEKLWYKKIFDKKN